MTCLWFSIPIPVWMRLESLSEWRTHSLAYAISLLLISTGHYVHFFAYCSCMPFPNTWTPSIIYTFLHKTHIFHKSLLIDWVQLLNDWVQLLNDWVQLLNDWVQLLNGWWIALCSDNCLCLHMQGLLKGCWSYWRQWRIHRERWTRRTSSTAHRFLATFSAQIRSWRQHRPQQSFTHTTTSYRWTSSLCLSHSARLMLRKSTYNLKCTQQCVLIILIPSSWYANVVNAWDLAVNMHVPLVMPIL